MATSETALVLLAAGGSSRMGAPKQLLDYGGKPLLRHAAETALASACRPVLVVLGANFDVTRPALDGLPVEIVANPTWAGGVGTSIRAGIEVAHARGVGGAILALADQPLVTAEILNRILGAHCESGRPIVASRYMGTVGVPVFFSRTFFPRLSGLAPDQGCKAVILDHAAEALLLDCPEAATDIDTPRDYDAHRARIVANLERCPPS